jgi:hypothetical protein
MKNDFGRLLVRLTGNAQKRRAACPDYLSLPSSRPFPFHDRLLTVNKSVDMRSTVEKRLHCRKRYLHSLSQ